MCLLFHNNANLTKYLVLLDSKLERGQTCCDSHSILHEILKKKT